MSTLYGPGPERPDPLRPVVDLAGLPVRDAEGRRAGTVYGSLADARTGLIRYIDIALEDDAGRHVLVPIGHARVERAPGGGGDVRLRAAVREELKEIPPFTGPRDRARLDDDYQRAVLAAHGRFFYGERYYAHPAFDHSGAYAGPHPILTGPVEREERTRLAPLSSLPAFRIPPDEPDIRGWPVHTADGEWTGTVSDLVVDPPERKIRYLVIGERRHEPREVMLPVGLVRIEPATRCVDTPVLTDDDLDTMPAAPGRSITRADERRLLERLEDRLDGARLFERPDFRAA
ncbi:MAG: PRC-barrel domain-containing protein [Gemmatimonadota bacterium]